MAVFHGLELLLAEGVVVGGVRTAVDAGWWTATRCGSFYYEALRTSDLEQQEAEMNAALQAAIPTGMPRGGLEVAIETHDEPFYGKMAELRAYTCKTRAKAGLSHFFRIASAYVIWREVRLTLAVTYMPLEDTRHRWSPNC